MRIPYLYFTSLLVVLSSCMKDDLLWNKPPSLEVLPIEGVFVINEGNFMYENASLSFYDLEKEEVYNDLFFESTGIPLGDLAQSISIRDSLAYIVLNNSGKIQIFNIHTFQYSGKITGFTSPRYIHFLDNHKAYVSDLYARSISIIDPAASEISGSIPVDNHEHALQQHSTEQFVQYDKYVFTNCWSNDRQILVIDSEADMLVDSIQVIKQPQSMVIDRFNKIWTLSDGGYEGSPYGYEAPGLTRINAVSREVEYVYRLDLEDYPSELTLNGSGDTLYFINKNIYRMPVISEGEPELVFENTRQEGYFGGFSALGVDPFSSEIYVADAMDYIQRGVVYRLSPAGIPIDTFKAGIIPGAFAFKASAQ